MPKTPRYVSALAQIIERVGDRPFRHVEVADLAAPGALVSLSGEGMIARAEREGKGATWQVTPLALERYNLPMILAEDGSREPLSRKDAALLGMWRAKGRRPFRASEVAGTVTVHGHTTNLQRQGYLERAALDTPLWRLTEAGAAFAASLARQVQEAALPSPQEASA